jgi:molecular chaperone DnaJ
LFRLKAKGVRSVRSTRQGDLMCRVQVETPVKLTGEQKDLLKKLENSMAEGDDKHNPRARHWMDSVREFFSRATS